MMLTDSQLTQVQETIFDQEDIHIYAIVDGASCPTLRFKIYEHKPISSCLWSGTLAPDIEEVAPYLVLLERDSQFTKWLIKNGIFNNWNIFVTSALEPASFRKEIRKLQLVRSPEGKSMMFRFYDPRVLRQVLPILESDQLSEFYTGFYSVFVPHARNKLLSSFTLNREKQALITKELSLANDDLL